MAPKLKLAEEENCYYFRKFFNPEEWHYKIETDYGIHHELTFDIDGKITSSNEEVLEAFKKHHIGQNIIQQNKTIMEFFKKIEMMDIEVSIKKEHIVSRKNGTKDFGFYVKVKNEPIVIWTMYKEEKKVFVVHGVFVHNDPKVEPIKRAIHELPKKYEKKVILALKESIKKESKYRVKLLVDNTFHL